MCWRCGKKKNHFTMSTSKRLHVQITNLRSPHLFWVIETPSLLDRNDLEVQLNAALLKPVAADPIVGEMVAVLVNDVWQRAVIHSIYEDFYSCWCIDYGLPLKTNQVYDLSDELKVLPAFAKQACLNNVVYLFTELNPVTSKIEYTETLDMKMNAVEVIKIKLKEAQEIFFVVEEEENSVHYGDIVLLKDKKFESLRESMVKDKILGINKELFAEAKNTAIQVSYSTPSSSRSSTTSAPVTPRSNFDDQKLESPPECFGRGRRPDLASSSQPKQSMQAKLQKLAMLSAKTAEKVRLSPGSETESVSEKDVTVKEAVVVERAGRMSMKEKLQLLKQGNEKLKDCERSVPDTSENIWADYKDNSPKLQNVTPSGVLPRKPTKKPQKSHPKTLSTHRLRRSSSTSNSPATSSSSDQQVPLKKKKSSCSSKTTEETLDSSSDTEISFKIRHRKKKIGCTCETCLMWDRNGLERDETEKFADGKEKERKVIVKPALLFKSVEEERKFTLKSLTSLPSFRNEKKSVLKNPALLVHGLTVPSPCLSVSDMYFHEQVHRVLSHMKFQHSKPIQSYVWPAVMRHTNVCYVNNAESGKTMTYVPAIVSFILDRERYSCFSETMIGPVAVVVCAGTRKAEQVYDMFGIFCNKTEGKFTVALAVPPLDTRCCKQFEKPVNILVATPKSLVNLLAMRRFNFKRLCHFVCEDVDVLLKKHGQHMNKLFGLLQSVLENRTCKLGIQVITSSEHWTNELESFVKRFALPPLVCIGAYLEAAIYGRTHITVKFLKSDLKPSKLVDILTSEDNFYNKCIVLCNSDAELKDATQLFPSRSIPYTTIESSLTETDINARENQWNSRRNGTYSVLLCTQDVFRKNLNVTDATFLIHYSLPLFWTDFSYRFSALVENLSSPLEKKDGERIQCKSVVFVDEECSTQCPRLVNLLRYMDVKLMPQFVKYCKDTLVLQEAKKVANNVKLCKTLKLLGTCESSKCLERHVLSKTLDVSENVPRNGTIRYKIIRVQDVTIYWINLIEHKDSEGNVHKNVYKSDEIEKELTAVLEKSKRCIEEFNVGDWVALEDDTSYNETVYKRCEVTKIIERGEITELPSNVGVLLLDTGLQKKVKVSKLCVLPEEFKKIPAQALTVYIANMVPPEEDQNFRSYSKQKVIDFLNVSTDEKYRECVYESKILVQIGPNLWVNNIQLVADLELTNTTVTLLKVKEKLLQGNLAEYREDCLEKLKALCIEAGIQVPEVVEEKTVKVVAKQAVPQWAFLDESEEYSEVHFCDACTPSEFSVRRKKFEDLLMQLQKDIQKVMEHPSYPTDVDVEIGRYCLAKDEQSGEYARVLIRDVEDEMADCYFVDYGDQQLVPLTQLRYLSDEFITRLPFQAIECRLYGVQPTLDSWTPASSDIFFENCFEPGTNYFQTLYAVVCKKEAPRLSKGEKFVVLLADVQGIKLRLFNQLLIDDDKAAVVVGEKLDKKFPTINQRFDEQEDEGSYTEDEPDECNEIVPETEGVGDTERPSSAASDDPWPWDVGGMDDWFKSMGINLTMEDIQEAAKDRRVAAKEEDSKLPPMTALPPVDYYTPRVVWFQTDVHIKLNILLADVVDYVLKPLRGKILHFSCKHDDKPYQLNLHLYDKIETAIKHSAGGQLIKVVLTKCMKVEWPRLVVQKKMRHISYDPSRCLFVEEREKPFLTFGKEFGEPLLEEGQNMYDFGSDEDYSESDVTTDSDDGRN